eukprot:3990334-Prymnesium_polylepis.1
MRISTRRARRTSVAHCVLSFALSSVPGWAYRLPSARRSLDAHVPQFPAKAPRTPFRVVVTLSIVHHV